MRINLTKRYCQFNIYAVGFKKFVKVYWKIFLNYIGKPNQT